MSEAMQEFSLADLADLDVSDIDEIRFETLPQGIFDFVVTAADLHETTKDGERLFYFEAKCEIEEVVSLIDKVEDPDSLKGKVQNQRQNIELGAEAEKGIGRVRAFATDIGVDSTGKMGAIIERMKQHRFRGKIVHAPDKNDPSIKYARLRLEKSKS